MRNPFKAKATPSATDTVKRYVRMGTNRHFILKEEKFRNLPVVRMLFREDVGVDSGIFIGGHLIRAAVVTQADSDDMIDLTIRVNAAQAANLSFVEAYDA